ncbi:MAG: terminase small subunit [Candidatus Beckwithbacteria bacterium]
MKLGRPSKYSRKIVKKANKYLLKCIENDELPTLQKLALLLGISTRAIYLYRDEHDEFMHTVEQIQNLQIDMLIQKALNNEYSASMATFLLKSIHNFREVDSYSHQVTQNYFHNITPELLEEANRL